MVSAPIIYMMLSLLASVFGFAGDSYDWQERIAHIHEVIVADRQPVEDKAGWNWGKDQAQDTDRRKAMIADLVDGILADERLHGAVTGVSIRHAENGELLYSHMGNIRLHPASNMKVLTAAAAFEVLGADYRFLTEVWTDGKIVDGVLTGNLYLKGKGDPTLMESDLVQFAKELKAMGIQRIEGHVAGDDSWYDDVRLSRDMDWTDEPYYYGAQVSALNLSPNEDYDAGTVIVEIRPGSNAGSQAAVSVIPATDYVTIVNKATTSRRGGANTIKVEREHGTNRIIVEGTIPLGNPGIQRWSSVWEPTGYVMDVFRKALTAEGIVLDSMFPEPLTAETPADATLLASKTSIPLRELIIPFMKLSNNGIGEVLTKEMGRVIHGEGSWDKGLEVIQDTVMQFGVDPETIYLRDGSGISHVTMIPADELSKLLYEIQKADWYPLFEDSLPVAGVVDRMTGGSLQWRMNGTAAEGNVKAKTGSLTTVSSLAGYVTTRDGQKLIFSILINNYVARTVKPVEDMIATGLARLYLD